MGSSQPELALRKFLAVHSDGTSPLLAAISGGKDSLALLFALKFLSQEVHIVHVDHGWRPESGQEAQTLAELAAPFPFHLRTLEKPKRNFEDEARQGRLKIYQELCVGLGAQGVLLGHHAGDQAETVCKRVFEGASLARLGGLQPVRTVEGVTLWRPFLELTRETLADEALRHTDWYVDDPTNRDPRFQRARIREFLGKEAGRPLVRLGKEAQELRAYLDRQIEPLKAKVHDGTVDCSGPIPRVELRHFVRHFCPGLSHDQLETACTLVEKGRVGGQVGPLWIDRGVLSLRKSDL